jgi:AcrR family transcriptional regulator
MFFASDIKKRAKRPRILSPATILGLSDNLIEQTQGRDLSVAEAAAIIGISSGALHKQFRNITEIRIAVVHRYLTQLTSDVETLPYTYSPIDDLILMLAHLGDTFAALRISSPVKFALVQATVAERSIAAAQYQRFVFGEIQILLNKAHLSRDLSFTLQEDETWEVASAVYSLANPFYLSEFSSSQQRRRIIDIAVWSLQN